MADDLLDSRLRMDTDWVNGLEVLCADVGSISRGSFAWARRLSPTQGGDHDPTSIEAMATAIVDTLQAGLPVAVGFEMPLFLPVPEAPTTLGKARPVDKHAPARSCAVGACAMATGLVQASWILRRVREESSPDTPSFTSWEEFAQVRKGLLVWEAFVTRDAKGATDEEDARIGIDAFCSGLPDPADVAAHSIERPLSLAALVLAWAGFEVSGEDLVRSGVLVRA